MSDIKSFFHQWCVKKSVEPAFDIRPTGPKHRQRFLCEVRVPGYNYVGAGNSTTKKDAQFNAARDFVQYMVRQGLILPNELPQELATKHGENILSGDSADGTQHSSGILSRPVFQPGMGPDTMGQAYTPFQKGNGPQTYIDVIAEQKRVEEAEEVDVNAAIHGNWTIENAKSKLHQFMQVNKIVADYKYTVVGPDHNRGFVAEMTIPCKKLGRSVTGRETGSNKQTASKSCALSIVRQLYHLGVIEAFSGTLKKAANEQIPAYEANVDPQLVERIMNLLNKLQINPPTIGDESVPPERSRNVFEHSSSNYCKKLIDRHFEEGTLTKGIVKLSIQLAQNLLCLKPYQFAKATNLIDQIMQLGKAELLTSDIDIALKM